MSYDGFLESKTSVSSSQLLNLRTAPVLLIPGKAGCVIDVISWYMRFVPNTTPFNPVATDTFVLFSGVLPSNVVTNQAFASAPATGFIDQSVDMSMWDTPTLMGVGVDAFHNVAIPLSAISGASVNLYQYRAGLGWNNGSNWTLGDGSLFVFLRYAYLEV